MNEADKIRMKYSEIGKLGSEEYDGELAELRSSCGHTESISYREAMRYWGGELYFTEEEVAHIIEPKDMNTGKRYEDLLPVRVCKHCDKLLWPSMN
jgi:hypothetical protein